MAQWCCSLCRMVFVCKFGAVELTYGEERCMKKVIFLLLIGLISMLSGCQFGFGNAPKDHAARIAYDIDSAFIFRWNDEEQDQTEKLHRIYDFSDLFSDQIYRKMGDLSDAYDKICNYLKSGMEFYQLLEVTNDADMIEATYEVTTYNKKKIYLFFAADIGDSTHKRGLQHMQMADNLNQLSKDRTDKCLIAINGENLLPQHIEHTPSIRQDDVTYKNQVSYARGDADALAQEVGELFIKHVRAGEQGKIKKMFSGSVWRYDKELDQQIAQLTEMFSDQQIYSFKIQSNTRESSTSSGSIKDGKNGAIHTSGHGFSRIGFDIKMKTDQGEKEIALEVFSHYEPNPTRIGIWNIRIYNEKTNEWNALAGL